VDHHDFYKTLVYIGECLKFTAVPAGLFELLPKLKRDAIENFLDKATVKSIKSSFITIIPAWFIVFIIPVLGKYLILVSLVWIISPKTLILLTFMEKSSLESSVDDNKTKINSNKNDIFTTKAIGISIIIKHINGIIMWIFGPLYRIIPHNWIGIILSPFDYVTMWIYKNIPGGSFIIPEYSTTYLINIYDTISNYWRSYEGDIWWSFWVVDIVIWFALLTSDGLMMILIIILPFSIVVFTIGCIYLTISIPIRTLFFISDLAKDRLGFQKENRIPLAAVILYALGESVVFSSITYTYFFNK
jgi:hypothetical protein